MLGAIFFDQMWSRLAIFPDATGNFNNTNTYFFENGETCSLIMQVFPYNVMNAIVNQMNQDFTKKSANSWIKFGKKNIVFVINKQENGFILFTKYEEK